MAFLLRDPPCRHPLLGSETRGSCGVLSSGELRAPVADRSCASDATFSKSLSTQALINNLPMENYVNVARDLFIQARRVFHVVSMVHGCGN